jgi:hypothetical protein
VGGGHDDVAVRVHARELRLGRRRALARRVLEQRGVDAFQGGAGGGGGGDAADATGTVTAAGCCSGGGVALAAEAGLRPFT